MQPPLVGQFLVLCKPQNSGLANSNSYANCLGVVIISIFR